jgi:hypothetical protein
LASSVEMPVDQGETAEPNTDNSVGLKRWEKVTYGLVYPAFFGNMVYDLLLPDKFSGDASLSKLFGLKSAVPEFWVADYCAAVLITLYYFFDYLHLHGDMNEVVGDRPKSATYIWCDFWTSTLYFVAFVLVTQKCYEFALMAIGFVPAITLLYKQRNKKNIDNTQYFKRYKKLSFIVGGLALAVSICGRMYGPENDKVISSIPAIALAVFAGLTLLWFLRYIFFFYVRPLPGDDGKSPRDIDKEFALEEVY